MFSKTIQLLLWIFSGIAQLAHFVWNFQALRCKSKNSRVFFQKNKFLLPSLTLFGFLLEWTIPEKKQGIWGYAVWGSFRYKEIASGTSRGCIKTMWNFSGAIKKKSCGIFRGLGFRYYNLKWEVWNTISWSLEVNITVKICFLWRNFQG